MPKIQVCMELKERELLLLMFSPETKRGQTINLTQVKVESVLMPEGWIEQSQINSQALTQSLLKVRTDHNIPQKTPVRLSIPLGHGFLRQYQLPWIAERHRASAIDYLAKEETPLSPDNLVYHYQVVAEDRQSNQMSVILGAMRRSVLESLVQVFKGAGFSLRAVEFSSATLAQALGFPLHERSLWLSDTGNGMQITLYTGMVPEMTRYFRLHDENHFEAWIPEIGRSFGLIHNPLAEPVRRIYASDSHTADWAREIVSAGFPGLHPDVAIILLEKVVRDWPWRSNLPENITAWLPVLGLALDRNLKNPQKDMRRIDLLTEYHVQHQRRRQETVLVFILTGILLAGLGFWYSGKHQLALLKTEVDILKTSVQKTQAKASKAEHIAKAWQDVKSKTDKISPSLNSLQGLAGPEVRFNRLEFKEGMLTLEGSAEQPEALERLLQGLQAQAWRDVRFREYHQEENAKIDFAVTASRR